MSLVGSIALVLTVGLVQAVIAGYIRTFGLVSPLKLIGELREEIRAK